MKRYVYKWFTAIVPHYRRSSLILLTHRSLLRLNLSLFVLLLMTSVSCADTFEKLPESHPTFGAINRVYTDVARAFGDGRKPPRLYVKSATSKSGPIVARFYPGTEGFLTSRENYQESAIVIDEKVFNLFQKEFGVDRDSALAVLIGHELVHYYSNQGWLAEFGNAFVDTRIGRQMAEMDKVMVYEATADEFGGFYAYLAGYDSLGMAPQVIDRIYAAFNLPAEMPGYPNKDERKKIALQSQKGLKEMIPLFDTANRLLVIGRYEEVARLFDYIGRSFPSREILNNAGVARTLAAIGLFPSGEIKFVFPLEFDAETRLRRSIRTKGFNDPAEEQRNELLGQALRDFDSAIARDPVFAVAYVNRAAVYELAGEHGRGLLDAEKGLELARAQHEETTVANAHIMHGIIMTGQNMQDKAVADFNAALGKSSSLAHLNLQVLKPLSKGSGFVAGETVKRVVPMEMIIERIAGLKPDDLRARPQGGTAPAKLSPLDSPTVERELSDAVTDGNRMKIRIKETAEWSGSSVRSAGSTLYLLATAAGYRGVSGRGVKIGSTLEELVQNYGNATRVVPSRQGTSHVYPGAEIVFTVGADNLVKGWMTYARGKN